MSHSGQRSGFACHTGSTDGFMFLFVHTLIGLYSIEASVHNDFTQVCIICEWCNRVPVVMLFQVMLLMCVFTGLPGWLLQASPAGPGTLSRSGTHKRWCAELLPPNECHSRDGTGCKRALPVKEDQRIPPSLCWTGVGLHLVSIYTNT